MLLLVFGALVFLFPVAAYCLFLAMVNNRPQPTMISGPWDFAGILFATSGFVLLGGPTVLGAFHSKYRMALSKGTLPNPGDLFDTSSYWTLIWGIYFLIVLLGAIAVLLNRRAITVIYNLEPAVLDEVLVRAFAQVRLKAVRIGNRFFLAPPSPALVGEPASQAIQAAGNYDGSGGREGPAPLPTEIPAKQKPVLSIDPFPAMRNVSLRWRPGNEALRGDVEAELGRELARINCEDNPVAGWFLTVASCLFGALFLSLVGFIIFMTKR